MEMDNELGITGKDFTTEFREYNSDIGRWFSLDPKPTERESWNIFSIISQAPSLRSE